MPTVIETTASAFKSSSSLLWLLIAFVIVGVFLPTPSTANPVAAPASSFQSSPPPETLFATCHFSDSSLIVIEEKLNQLFVRLSDGSGGSDGEEHQKKMPADEMKHHQQQQQQPKKKKLLSEAIEKEEEENDDDGSIERLNSTYRSLVNRFAQVPEEESPLPALGRMRRQIWETLNNVPRAHYPNDGFAFGDRPFTLDEEEEWENEVEDSEAPSSTIATTTTTTETPVPSTAASAAKDSKISVVHSLPPKWHSMLVTCLEHYRILKRIILFERFLRSQQDEQQKKEQQQSVKEKLINKLKDSLQQNHYQKLQMKYHHQQQAGRPSPGWHQKMICSISRRLMDMSACLQLYGACLLANKVLIAGFAAVIMLILVLNCFRFSGEELMFHKWASQHCRCASSIQACLLFLFSFEQAKLLSKCALVQ